MKISSKVHSFKESRVGFKICKTLLISFLLYVYLIEKFAEYYS